MSAVNSGGRSDCPLSTNTESIEDRRTCLYLNDMSKWTMCKIHLQTINPGERVKLI